MLMFNVSVAIEYVLRQYLQLHDKNVRASMLTRQASAYSCNKRAAYTLPFLASPPPFLPPFETCSKDPRSTLLPTPV